MSKYIENLYTAEEMQLCSMVKRRHDSAKAERRQRKQYTCIIALVAVSAALLLLRLLW